MKRACVFILCLLTAFCLANEVKCDSCVKWNCCQHAPKKPGAKITKSIPPGINICIDNSQHGANCAFEPCDMKGMCFNEKKETDCPTPNYALTPMWVTLAALLVSLFATFYGNYVIRKNLQKQIEANRSLELEKRELDILFKIKLELKETCAKFLNLATTLNNQLDEIIYSDLEEGRVAEAYEKFAKTESLRNELKGYYYSLKVTLDGSKEQKSIEKSLDDYMNATCFEPNIEKMEQDKYTQPLGALFHKVKAIIHKNYPIPE